MFLFLQKMFLFLQKTESDMVLDHPMENVKCWSQGVRLYFINFYVDSSIMYLIYIYITGIHFSHTRVST